MYSRSVVNECYTFIYCYSNDIVDNITLIEIIDSVADCTREIAEYEATSNDFRLMADLMNSCRTPCLCMSPRSNMVASVLEGSVSSDDSSSHFQSALTCYLCGELFRRPRILPCGHTFCSECLARLREEVIRDSKLNGTFDCKMKEIGHFVCPMPQCRYSMRLMNLSRFTAKNKSVSEAIGALKRRQQDKQDVSTQTDITLESVIIAVPQSIINNTRKKLSDNSSFVNTVFQRAISMDNIHSNYIPSRDITWRSCIAMLGVNIIQQIMQM